MIYKNGRQLWSEAGTFTLETLKKSLKMLKTNKILLLLSSLILLYSCSEEKPAPGAKTPPAKKQDATEVPGKAAEPAPARVKPATPAKSALDRDYLMGKFEPSKHPDFVSVKAPYTDRTGMMLRRETFEAFREMWKAAKKEGVELNIKSSTRNFQQQKAIWDGKWKKYAKEKPEAKERALKILEILRHARSIASSLGYRCRSE
jgi:LAS superfamily LD-carboxypeptidase LdcB